MKRPGGFDRETDRAPDRETARRAGPESGQSSNNFFGGRRDHRPNGQPAVPRVTDSAQAIDPDRQLTDVIPDEHLPVVAPQGEAPLNDAPQGDAPQGGVIEGVTQDSQTALARVLAWIGVGAPKDPVRAADRRVRAAARARKGRERRERRRFAGQLHKHRRGWLVAGGAVVVLALFVAVCAFTPLTAVREVKVVGAQAVPQQDLAQALSRFEGVPLALVDDTEVHRALEVFPLVQRYQVERIPPHTLIVEVTERVPVIVIENDGVFDQFDAAGVKVGSGDAAPAGVPVGTGAVTDLASPAFATAARVVRDMSKELRARVTAVSATSTQDVTLTLDGGPLVVWGDDSETGRKSVVLQSMIVALGDRAIEQIDVSSPEVPVFR